MRDVRLTTGWRVTIPIEIRRALGIRPKDRIEFNMPFDSNAALLRVIPHTSARTRRLPRRK